MRRLAVLSLLVSSTGLVVVAGPASGATECQGQQATIVGEPGARVEGTDDPDVIVTNGATYVYAGAGDDLVCATTISGRTWVSAGAGDDSVVADDNDYERLRVDLGPGSDRFVGGAGRDTVKTFDPVDAPSRADDVSTGPGNDVVLATRPIGPATADADRIDLGPGRDTLAMGDSGLAPTASVRGGPGRDRIAVNSDNEGTDVAIDARARTIERGGPYLRDWVSFEEYFVKEFDAVVTFEGSSASEALSVSAARRYVARMGGGDDVVAVDSNQRAVLSGGRGSDEVVVRHLSSSGGSWIDLAKGHVGTVSGHKKRYATIAGFEDATAIGGDQPLVVGDRRANSLVAGCGTIRGGRGADRIEEHTPGYLRYPHPDACSDFAARGGRGRDVLLGSAGPDVLLGGPGRDRAVGRKGRDRCVAEIERGCER